MDFLNGTLFTHLDSVSYAGVDPLSLAISVGFAALSGYLAKRKGKVDRDDAPTALATRGAFVPYIRGTRRVGYAFALAGGRRTVKRKTGGKGIFGGPTERQYIEHGLHVLALGPIYGLHTIFRGGKAIFKGPITQRSHPSGSSISIPKVGTFRIYWGEKDQPVDSFLADSARIGIASRWPLFCYIVWNDINLGTAPRWETMEYVLEGRVQGTGLVDTVPEMDPSANPTEGGTIAITGFTDGAEGTGKFRLQSADKTGIHIDRIEVDEDIILAGNTMSSDTYQVLKVTTGTAGSFPFETFTDVFLVGGVSGADANGTIQPTEVEPDSGVNLAHVIWELLFGASPYGAGMSTDDWDLPSLEALGTLIVTEGLRGSVAGENGDTIEAVLASILQDLGVVVGANYSTGLLEFVSMRKPGGGLPDIPAEMILAPLPERDQIHGEKPTDSMIFSFQDRLLSWRTNTIAIDDDGVAFQLNHKRFTKIPIASTSHFGTAALIANRRELEELTTKAKVKLVCNRDARTLKPGDAITVADFDDNMRVWGNTQDPLTGKVTLEIAPDWFGLDLDTFENTPPGISVDPNPVALDAAQVILEVPEGLLTNIPGQAIVVPRIRANAAVATAGIHLSADGTTFNLVGTEGAYQAGGTITAELLSTSPTRTGAIQFTALGPDIANVLDLSSDEINWRLGRQIMVISSANGTEICYIRGVTSLGGGIWSADDVMRGRYCTPKLTHASGSAVFIFEFDGILRIEDIILQPDAAIEVKVQPEAAGTIAIDSIPPLRLTLHGEGRKPRDPVNLRLSAPAIGLQNRNVFETGDNITVKWSICLPITDAQGAGSIAAGTILFTDPLQGDYTIEWLTTGDVLKRTDTVTDLDSITYTNANMVTDFSGEPSALKARVFQTALGFDSRAIEITITLV